MFGALGYEISGYSAITQSGYKRQFAFRIKFISQDIPLDKAVFWHYTETRLLSKGDFSHV